MFGHDTLIAIRGNRDHRGLAWYLGAEDHWLAEGKPLYRQIQIIVRAPWRRSLRQQARGKRRYLARRRQLARQRHYHSGNLRQLGVICMRDYDEGRIVGWDGLSTGNDIPQKLRQLADRGQMFCEVTGRWVRPSVAMMRALAHVSSSHRVQVTALTGGRHMVGSQHYSGHADDLATWTRSVVAPEFRAHGGRLLIERDHDHWSFP